MGSDLCCPRPYVVYDQEEEYLVQSEQTGAKGKHRDYQDASKRVARVKRTRSVKPTAPVVLLTEKVSNRTREPHATPCGTHQTYNELNQTCVDDLKVSCLTGSRQYVVMPIPEAIRQVYNWPIKNQAMFLSTGTSNALNFGSVYFPFAGVNEVPEPFLRATAGWLIKFSSSQRENAWRARLCTLVQDWIIPSGIGYSIMSNYCSELSAFLDKFAFWWQVRLSAALGGDFWERADVRYLYDLARLYDWNNDLKDFVMEGEHSTWRFSKAHLSVQPCDIIANLTEEAPT